MYGYWSVFEIDYLYNDVNGNPLQLHGKLTCSLTLGSADYRLNCLICNISQDAILGQDFLLQYDKNVVT
jgi:hypothetical protein